MAQFDGAGERDLRVEKALVADEHPLCRGGVSAMLRHDLGISRVQQVADYSGVLMALGGGGHPGLALVDLGLPGMNEMDGVRQLRANHPQVLLIVMAWRPERSRVLGALAAGAHGYVPKHYSWTDMISAIRTVLSGQIYVPANLSDVSAGALAGTGRARMSDTVLTGRQREVLSLLAAGKSNKEIGRVLAIAEGTVKVHIAAAFRQLGVHNRVSAAAALQSKGAGADPDRRTRL